MQRDAWINTIAALVFGALCLLLRWLQGLQIFDVVTGLAERGAPVSWLLGLMMALAVAALWALTRRFRRMDVPVEPEEAMGNPPVVITVIMAVAGLMAALGCMLMFFSAETALLKFTALLGLLSVPALLLYPLLPRWGGLGAALSLGPVAFFCVWLVVIYRVNAADPVVWRYAPLILAVAAVLLVSYRLASYLFYRVKPRSAIHACSIAPVFTIAIIMDETAGAARLVLGAWALGMLAMTWLLISNIRPYEEEEEEY